MWPFSGRIQLPIAATINRILACSEGWNPREARNLEIEQRQPASLPCWSVEAESPATTINAELAEPAEKPVMFCEFGSFCVEVVPSDGVGCSDTLLAGR